MPRESQVSWGRQNVQLRKEEYLKQIQAFWRDQLQGWNHGEVAELYGCSTTTERSIRNGRLDLLSLDMLYVVAMNLEMGPSVTIPEYGTHMGA